MATPGASTGKEGKGRWEKEQRSSRSGERPHRNVSEMLSDQLK